MAENEANFADVDERDDALIGSAFRWSAAALAIIITLGLGVVWWMTRPEPPRATTDRSLTLPTARSLPNIELPRIPFTDITRAAGIDFVHETGAYGDKLLPETMGGGCAFFDYDNDNDQDILLVNARRWPWDTRSPAPAATLALYRNDGKGSFENVTEAVGLDASLYGMGVAVADYDGDGFVDIFLTAVGPCRLFRNIAGKKFRDVTDEAGVAGAGDAWSTSCGWLDFDNDGDLDLFVGNYVAWSKEIDLSQHFDLTGSGRAYGRPLNFAGTFPTLYRNNGHGAFVDVSAAAGIQVANANTGVAVAKALGVAFADFDRDGWLDIVVANDTVQNFLFHNQRDGTFQEIGQIAGVAFDVNGLARGAMGIDIADFRSDGELGIAIGNFANEMSALYVSRKGKLRFKDDAVSNGLGPATRTALTFGVFFFDADLDGRLDYLQANGHLEEDIARVQESQRYEQSPQLFWNCGAEHATEFVLLPPDKCGDDFVKPMVGRGAAYADIDADGDLDVLLTASGGRPRLLRNDQRLGHHWIRVTLAGSGKNRDAIGASVELALGDSIQRRFVSPARSYLSQCESTVTFGVGKAASADRLTVIWPSGQRTTLEKPPVDRALAIQESAD